MKTAVVYGIRNKKNNKYYIGSTRDIKTRWEKHRQLLEKGHHSPKLQKAWDKSSPNDWECTILEKNIPLLHQFLSEQHWIDTLDTFESGYNTRPRAGSYVMFDNRGYDWFVKERQDDILTMLEMMQSRVPYRTITVKFGVSLGFLTKLKEQYKDLLKDVIQDDEQKAIKSRKLKAHNKLKREEKANRNKKVIALLQEGIPYRKISKITGCSLGTITNIKKRNVH